MQKFTPVNSEEKNDGLTSILWRLFGTAAPVRKRPNSGTLFSNVSWPLGGGAMGGGSFEPVSSNFVFINITNYVKILISSLHFKKLRHDTLV